MKLTPSQLPMPKGSSYFWDAPQLPKDGDLYPYVKNEDGDEVPLQFICQINCAELPPCALPSKGMLYFFGTVDYFLGYDVVYDNGLGWWRDGSVVAIYSDADLDTLERQNPYTEDDMILPHPITFTSTPNESDDGFRLLGKPFEDDVRQEVPRGWVQLLQLDSEETEHFSLMFHDMGLLYVFIEKERLAKGDFSRLRAYMTSM